MRSLCLILFFVIGFEIPALAFDIPIPGNKSRGPANPPNGPQIPSEKASPKSQGLDVLLIEIDKNATEAKLMIPEAIIRRLQSETDKPSFYLPQNVIESQPVLPRIGTVIGGLLMTLAFVFGGLWLARNRKMSAVNLAAGVVILSLSGIGTASIVYANAGPPPEVRSLTGKIFSSPVHSSRHASGELRVEVTKDEIIQLIVPER